MVYGQAMNSLDYPIQKYKLQTADGRETPVNAACAVALGGRCDPPLGHRRLVGQFSRQINHQIYRQIYRQLSGQFAADPIAAPHRQP